MRAITISPVIWFPIPGQPVWSSPRTSKSVTGAFARDIEFGGGDDAPLLADLDRPVHAVVLESDDVHEDDAGARLASAIAGSGLTIRGPSFSRYNLVANTKGLLRVDAGALLRLNRLPGVAIFTLEDRIPAVPGKIVTGVKVTPVAVAGATLLEAETIAAEGAVVQVVPFQPLQVGRD